MAIDVKEFVNISPESLKAGMNTAVISLIKNLQKNGSDFEALAQEVSKSMTFGSQQQDHANKKALGPHSAKALGQTWNGPEK